MYCVKCGNEINKDNKFCKFCGTEVKNESSVSNPPEIRNANNKVDGAFEILPASQSKRFLNLILDYVGFYIFAYLCGLVLGLLGLAFIIEGSDSTILGFIILLVYYLLFEGIFSKTPAKYLTKTKVVTIDGKKPDFVSIIVRTVCRFIPFDQFSFLESTPVGWHDKLSKTLVVDEK